MLIQRLALRRSIARAAVGGAVIAGTVYDRPVFGWPGHYTQPAAHPTPAPASDELSAQLLRLAQLHARELLTDEEFAAAKKKLLAS